jgi:hypothetical protein
MNPRNKIILNNCEKKEKNSPKEEEYISKGKLICFGKMPKEKNFSFLNKEHF